MASQLIDMSDNVRARVTFGPFVADVQTHELWKEGVRIKLVGQPFEILEVLLNNPGKLVTREELRSRLWAADTFVDFNHGLNAAINKLREALCDSAESPRYIETLPRRGYRFIAPVQAVAPAADARSVVLRPDPVLVKSPSPTEGRPSQPDLGEPSIVSTVEPRDTDERVRALPRRSVWVPILTSAGLLAIVLFTFLVWSSLRPDQPTRVGRRAVTPPILLTDLGDPTSDPALSPDGTRVAFRRQGYVPGNSGIFVKTIGSQQLLQLTNSVDDCCPVWSPNGREIAFSRFTDDEHQIYSVSASGGGLYKLYSTDVGPKHGELDWSPDGSSIAFVGKSSQGSSSIFLLSKQDLTARRITEPAPLERDWGPAFSPDGQSLAFIRTHETGLPENVLIMPAAGGESRVVTSFYNGIIGPPAWTRDGQSVVFASGGGLLRAPVFGGGQTSQIDEAGSPAGHPAIARDGYVLAYEKVSQSLSVWELDPNGHAAPHGLVISESGRNEGAQLSPDGKKLAFMSSRSGSMELWVSDRDGSNPFQVTAMNGIGTPHWSPNGRSIAFDVGWHDRGGVFVVDVPGGLPRPLAQDNSDSLVPNWSRDGKWVYFASNRSGIWQVWKVAPQGGTPVQVTTHGGFAACPSLDGKTVYYSKFNLPQPEIWQVPVEGGVETRIPQVRPDDWANWAPVEKGIYFVAKDFNQRPNVMFFDFATSTVKKAANIDLLPFWLSASPDGKALFYEHLDQENTHIMLLKNFQ